MTVPFLVDSMDDLSRALFGDLPHSAAIIAPDGTIFEKLPWAEPELVEAAVQRCLADATARLPLATGFWPAQHAWLLGVEDGPQLLQAVFLDTGAEPRDRALAARSLASAHPDAAEIWLGQAEAVARGLWRDAPARLEAFLPAGD